MLIISWSIFQTSSISFPHGGTLNNRLQYELYRANFGTSFKNKTLRDVNYEKGVVKLKGKALILGIRDLEGDLSSL